MEQVVKAVTIQKGASVFTLQNFAALGLALLIDFSDSLPADLLFAIGLEPIWIGYDAAITVVEASFLAYLGVPAVKWLTVSGTDMIPIVNLIPWCTLAVLDKRFNVKIPLLTRLFNH